MSGFVALVIKLFISMKLLLLRCECLHDGIKIEAPLVTQLVLAPPSIIVRMIILRFIRTNRFASTSIAISTIVPRALAVTKTKTNAINVVWRAIIAS
jgi:hypothetical protein